MNTTFHRLAWLRSDACGKHLGALGKNSENSLESGEIEGQDKLKDQEEKRIMNYVESINIDAVKKNK